MCIFYLIFVCAKLKSFKKAWNVKKKQIQLGLSNFDFFLTNRELETVFVFILKSDWMKFWFFEMIA
jgi:hypothetical protein